MSGIYLCQNGDSLSDLCNATKNQDTANKIQRLNPKLSTSTPLHNGQAIILPSQNELGTQASRQFMLQSSPSSIRNLSKMTETMPGPHVAALAEVSQHLGLREIAPDLNTFGGAGLSAATARSSDFLTALKKYDDALAEYFAYKSHRAAPGTVSRLKLVADNAFKELQIKFNNETTRFLNRYPPKMETIVQPRPGRPNFTIHREVPLTSASGAQSLAKFARYGKALGYGMVALDGYFRYQTVNDIRMRGGNWQREAWAQGAGFITGVGLGIASFAILLGPLGIVVGILVAGAAAVMIDKGIVSLTRNIYDWVN